MSAPKATITLSMRRCCLLALPILLCQVCTAKPVTQKAQQTDLLDLDWSSLLTPDDDGLDWSSFFTPDHNKSLQIIDPLPENLRSQKLFHNTPPEKDVHDQMEILKRITKGMNSLSKPTESIVQSLAPAGVMKFTKITGVQIGERQGKTTRTVTTQRANVHGQSNMVENEILRGEEEREQSSLTLESAGRFFAVAQSSTIGTLDVDTTNTSGDTKTAGASTAMSTLDKQLDSTTTEINPQSVTNKALSNNNESGSVAQLSTPTHTVQAGVETTVEATTQPIMDRPTMPTATTQTINTKRKQKFITKPSFENAILRDNEDPHFLTHHHGGDNNEPEARFKPVGSQTSQSQEEKFDTSTHLNQPAGTMTQRQRQRRSTHEDIDGDKSTQPLPRRPTAVKGAALPGKQKPGGIHDKLVPVHARDLPTLHAADLLDLSDPIADTASLKPLTVDRRNVASLKRHVPEPANGQQNTDAASNENTTVQLPADATLSVSLSGDGEALVVTWEYKVHGSSTDQQTDQSRPPVGVDPAHRGHDHHDLSPTESLDGKSSDWKQLKNGALRNVSGVNTPAEVNGWVVSYHITGHDGEEYDSSRLGPRVRSFVLHQLHPDEDYIICVHALAQGQKAKVACATWSRSSLKVVVGVLAGTVFLIPCIIVMIMILVKDRRVRKYSMGGDGSSINGSSWEVKHRSLARAFSTCEDSQESSTLMSPGSSTGVSRQGERPRFESTHSDDVFETTVSIPVRAIGLNNHNHHHERNCSGHVTMLDRQVEKGNVHGHRCNGDAKLLVANKTQDACQHNVYQQPKANKQDDQLCNGSPLPCRELREFSPNTNASESIPMSHNDTCSGPIVPNGGKPQELVTAPIFPQTNIDTSIIAPKTRQSPPRTPVNLGNRSPLNARAATETNQNDDDINTVLFSHSETHSFFGKPKSPHNSPEKQRKLNAYEENTITSI